MDCNDFRNCISAYIDGDLTKDEAGVFETHLASCNSCAFEFELMSRILGGLGSMPSIEPPEHFHDILMDGVRAGVKSRKVGFYRRYGVVAAAFLCCLIMASAIGGLVTEPYMQNKTDMQAAAPAEAPSVETVSEAVPFTAQTGGGMQDEQPAAAYDAGQQPVTLAEPEPTMAAVIEPYESKKTNEGDDPAVDYEIAEAPALLSQSAPRMAVIEADESSDSGEPAMAKMAEEPEVQSELEIQMQAETDVGSSPQPHLASTDDPVVMFADDTDSAGDMPMAKTADESQAFEPGNGEELDGADNGASLLSENYGAKPELPERISLLERTLIFARRYWLPLGAVAVAGLAGLFAIVRRMDMNR